MRKVVGTTLAMLRRRPGTVAAALLGLVMTGGIVGNAVLFQTGRHPAPLFGRGTPAPLPAGPSAAEAPMPVSRTAEAMPLPADPSGDVAVPNLAVEPTPSVRPLPVQPTAASTPDAVGRFLRQEDRTSNAGPSIASAQRALERLGFVVKRSGRMDKATRSALDKFAVDHHLPKNSDLSPNLLRAIEAAAAHRQG